ncbi:hypothetical protein AGMMS4957_22190 [Bacteroidia bacterium]|nr:hypothetical protein AGMMS4957_22190 [Bacteroidia bacterium]
MLSKQAILDRTNNGFEVFRYYIDAQWQLGKNFCNPLYDDKKASCNVYFDRRYRVYKFKDFGNDTYSGDCFSFVGFLKGLDCNNTINFVEILKIINQDLSLGLADSSYTFSQPITAKPNKQELPEPKKAKRFSFIVFTSKFF